MSPSERDEIVHTLQAVGILGFMDEESQEGDEEGPGMDGGMLNWPFPNHASLRSTYQRMGPNTASLSIFSSPFDDKNTDRAVDSLLSSESSNNRTIDDRHAGPKILEYLNDDVLRHVFLFFGYKRLVRASAVCKVWCTISNLEDMWRQAYCCRFRIVQEDAALAPSGKSSQVDFSWKKLFISKWLAERDLRFCRNTSGWKHRTCDFLGCLMVIKSKGQLKRHAGVHKKKKPKKKKNTKTMEAKQKGSSGKLCVKSSAGKT